MSRRVIRTIGMCCAVLWLATGCIPSFKLNDAQIPPEAQTVSIPLFPNVAPLVTPTLSATFTDALQQKFVRQTRLSVVQEEGDLQFSGEIVGYTSTPVSVTAAEEFASAQNRLTITVRVQYTNTLQPENSFAPRTFSQYADYNSSSPLSSVEGQLIPQIVDDLVTDIYNAAFSNW